jgi:hypothetical protein
MADTEVWYPISIIGIRRQLGQRWKVIGVVLQFPMLLGQLHRKHRKNYEAIIRSRIRPKIGP